MPFYTEWNEKINVISRKDLENLYLHHVLHSLGLAKIINFAPFTEVIDVGTGGGFPGIPLAILFPQARFHLIDSTLKKIKIVQQLIETLQLTNVFAEQLRAEQAPAKHYDFVVARGVTNLAALYSWTQKLTNKHSINKLANGLLAYKGGNLKPEIEELPSKTVFKIYDLHHFFAETWFAEKYLIHIRT